MNIRAGSQVFWRQRIRGESLNLIKTGHVVSIKGWKAIVHFPADRIRREVPVSELELTSTRYPGRSSVNIDPLKR